MIDWMIENGNDLGFWVMIVAAIFASVAMFLAPLKKRQTVVIPILFIGLSFLFGWPMFSPLAYDSWFTKKISSEHATAVNVSPIKAGLLAPDDLRVELRFENSKTEVVRISYHFQVISGKVYEIVRMSTETGGASRQVLCEVGTNSCAELLKI